MIARIWHGRVPKSKASDYRNLLNNKSIPDYKSVPGNLGVYILEKDENDIVHFITLTFWQDKDSIKKFAGNNIELPKYYPEDKNFLLEFEDKVVHYEVVGNG